MRQVFLKYKLHHLLFWLLLFAAWHFFRYQDYPRSTGLWISLLKVTDLALMVYLTNYLLIPQLLYKKRYWIFGISFLSIIAASSILKMYLLGQLMNNPRAFDFSSNIKGRIYDNILPHILLVSTGAAFKLVNDQFKAQKRVLELVKEKSSAELNFLKSQINPHFVFNSLNAVYFLIHKENTAARETLLQFSDLLRYQLYDCNEPTVPIEKEVAFLRDFVRLQELRKGEQYDFQLTISDTMKGFSIAPLLLIPFVENAFKHLSHHGHQSNYARIELDKKGNVMSLVVINSKDNQQKKTEPLGGIGLANVKRRLELIYPGKHQLHISDTAKEYSVSLLLTIV
jgi:two-component system, LytTR family, sensor kinase